MKRIWLQTITLTAVVLVLNGRAGAQSPSQTRSQNLIGRLSTGWNYYSLGNSFAPQLSSLSSNLMLNYRLFDDSNKIKYQFKLDAYEKNGFQTTRDTVNRNQFKNRYLIRQLYVSYGGDYRQIKIGRVLPLVTTMDAYPINGVSVENYALTKSLDVSAFGGTINDYYKNGLAGTGYNYGAAINFIKNPWCVGLGYTGENYYNTRLQKIFAFAEYRRLQRLRVTQKIQYLASRGKLGYAITNLYYRISKKLNVRTTFDYYDRTTNFVRPTDTLSLRDKYFYSALEKNITLSVNYHIYSKPSGSLDAASTIKKRVGNGNLSYESLQLNYRNYFWVRFNMRLEGSYTSNQWLDNARTGFALNRDFLKGQLDVTFSAAVNSYHWNFADSNGVKTASSSRSLFIVSTDFAFHFSRSFYTSFSFSQELGDANDRRSAAYVRLNYYLR